MSEQSQRKFACNQCGQSYAWMPQLVGKKVRCKCGNVMVGPEAGKPAVSLPAAPKLGASVAPPHASKQAPRATTAAAHAAPAARSGHTPARPAAAAHAAAPKRAQAAAPPPPPSRPAPAPAPEQDDLEGGFDDLSDDLYALAGEMEKAAAAAAPIADAPAAGYRCPGCGGDVPVGTVICGQCGFNFQTGTKGHAPAVASNIAHPGLATAAPLGTGRFAPAGQTAAPSAPASSSDGGGNRKLVLYGGIGAAAIVVLVLGVMLVGGGSGGSSPAALDQYAAKQAGSAQEARAWLAGNEANTLGMLGRPEAEALVAELYDQGATEVKVASSGKRALELIVVLPSAKDARTKIFTWERQRGQKWGYEPEKDADQKYLLVYPYYVEPPASMLPTFTFPGTTGTPSDGSGDDDMESYDDEESYDE